MSEEPPEELSRSNLNQPHLQTNKNAGGSTKIQQRVLTQPYKAVLLQHNKITCGGPGQHQLRSLQLSG